MKLVRALCAITLIVMVLSVGLVSALEQNEASVNVGILDQQARGEHSSVHIQFVSNTEKTLAVYYVGIHFDWMDKDQLYGIDLSSSPKTVAALKSTVFDIINYTVPTDASFGAHSYYIGVDGYDGDGNAFSWTSDERTISVVTPQSSSQPTSTPTATNQNPQNFDMNLIIYGAIIAAVAVIVILIVVVMKKRGANAAAKPNTNPTVPPKPEQKPEEEPGQDFNI